MIAAMLRRRQEWIDQAVLLAHRWHVPLIAVRTIHEYVVGFNWPAVLEGFNTQMRVSDDGELSSKRHRLS